MIRLVLWLLILYGVAGGCMIVRALAHSRRPVPPPVPPGMIPVPGDPGE